jgi:hypothetical protein
MARKLNFKRSLDWGSPTTPEERATAERILARLIATAYAADHPELFGGRGHDVPIMGSRPEATAPSLCGPEDQGIMTAGETHALTE